MTEATPEATTEAFIPNGVLVRHAIYSYYGITRIATDDNLLQSLTGIDTVTVTPDQVTLLEEPGCPAWVDRMVRARSTLNRANHTYRNELDEKTSHLERLGEALLSEANERDWCAEYDAFAEEWDLPKRSAEWEVTMTVRVTARTEDDAITIVRDNVSLTSYDGAESEPEYYASTT